MGNIINFLKMQVRDERVDGMITSLLKVRG